LGLLVYLQRIQTPKNPGIQDPTSTSSRSQKNNENQAPPKPEFNDLTAAQSTLDLDAVTKQ
jgi:hypothetical protein